MTKTEARKIATAMNVWRRADTTYSMPCTPAEFGIAIDILIQPSTIAENIRNAAINWPQFVGGVESQIVDSFCNRLENFNVDWDYRGTAMSASSFEGRMFMLFVAEALE